LRPAPSLLAADAGTGLVAAAALLAGALAFFTVGRFADTPARLANTGRRPPLAGIRIPLVAFAARVVADAAAGIALALSLRLIRLPLRRTSLSLAIRAAAALPPELAAGTAPSLSLVGTEMLVFSLARGMGCLALARRVIAFAFMSGKTTNHGTVIVMTSTGTGCVEETAAKTLSLWTMAVST
jgi:hypothetical protein